MALDPTLLDSLPNALVDMYSLVEIDILEDMARRISTYDFFIPAALHQNQKLQELGMTQQHIIEALAGMTGQTQQEIVDLLTEASEMAVADDVEYYTAAEVYEPTQINTEALHKQLNSGLLQTQQAFKNITRTTANTASKQFENALDRAWTQINVGGMDYNTAIRRAVEDLSDNGVGAIEYKSGRVDSLEVAVRRAVVTGANQTALKTQPKHFVYMGYSFLRYHLILRIRLFLLYRKQDRDCQTMAYHPIIKKSHSRLLTQYIKHTVFSLSGEDAE
jgi:hypothetical protein